MRLRIGFQLSITGLFVLVVLGVGLTLVYLSFDRAKEISRSAAATYIERVAEHTADRVSGGFASVLTVLEVLRQLPSVETAAISDNPRLYALLAALLREHTQLYNLYVGYEDGRFIELDALDRGGPAFRTEIGAPAHAEFRLTVIDALPDHEGRLRRTMFLSPDLAIVAENKRPADYDPRERPWYRGAFEPNASRVTNPYVFNAAALTGYTARVPSTAGRQGVVAADILLADTDAFLRTQRLGRSGVVFLLDDRGRVFAHPRLTEFIKRQPSGAVDLPRLDQVETIDVGGALAGFDDSGSAQVFEAGGRTYVGAVRPVTTGGPAKLRVVVTAPLDEFFADIERQRWRLFALALALVGAALPIVWWIGSMLARAIKSLSFETDRIRHFELTGPAAPLTSMIREIDDLGRSVSTMRTVVQTFSAFVPRRLVQTLIETGAALRLGGERRQVTIMFTDIEDFTRITEHADPERVMLYTSRYLAALSQAVMAHKGTVDKFVGDAVMAIWNAPSDDADHIANACAAALACRQANRDLNVAFAREGWPAYRTRFGLHTGEAVVGNIGSPDRMNYTVLGAAVNLAARLEPLNKDHGTEILVSEAIATAVAGQFRFRAVGTIKPKGFDAEVRVFELMDVGRSSQA